MKPLRFKSIRTRLLFWFLFLSLSPLLIGIVTTYYHQKKAIEQETIHKLTAIRDLKVQQLEQWIEDRNGDLRTIAGDYEIRVLEGIFEKNIKSSEDIEKINIARELLKRINRNYGDYEEIFIIGANTEVIELSSVVSSEGDNKSQDPYFTVPMKTGDIYIKDIYYSNTTGSPQMSFSIPIFCLEHNKDIIGILVARINLQESLYKLLLNRVGLGETGETLIVNEDVIALNELRWYENAPLNLKISAESAERAAQGKTGITVTKDYRGEEILAAYTYIPEVGWGFVTKQDTNELNKPISSLLVNYAILFLISSLIVLIIVFWLIKRISKPILDISAATQKIKAGDYTVRTYVNSQDELASLAESINEMTASINSREITQKAVTDISDVMIGKSSMQDFGSELLKKLMEITGANMSTFYILNELTSEYEHFASVGANEKLLQPFSSDNPEGEFGNALSQNSIYYLRNIPENTKFKYKTTAGEATPQEMITIPILVDNIVVAIISLVNIQKFNKECYDILKQSWQSINSSYSSLMSSERTTILAEQLFSNNQKLEAQTEELQDQAEELQDQATELQHTSEELQEQNLELSLQRKQVEAANSLKSEFLSNMSHELRTPLNSIMALSRVLIMQAKDRLTEEENNYLEIIERNGKRLLSLINDILDLSKIEAGKMEIIAEPMSIGSLLFTIKENMQTTSMQKGVAITLSLPNDLPKVETDEARLYQVLTNIISNAVKFTEKGSVDIVVKHDNENVIVEVKDTGIGISKDVLPHIFDEFRQADGSSSRQFEGTGLGLAIGNKMIKILGGKIDAISKLGEGSVFTITLPIIWHEDITTNNIINYTDNSIHTVEDLVLVVDDDPKVTKDICDYLNEAGYITITASTGKEALELAEKFLPIAITLDIIMPEMDGWEVMQKLKENQKTKDIPVIIISVSDDRETGIALGAVGYINKPVARNILISEIYKLNKAPDTVMIVDDNNFELNQISNIIKSEKINTVLASTGEECFKLLEDEIPDVLVLDLMMPGIDGFEVLDKIRKKKETRDLPVIIVTAKDLTVEDRSRLSGQISSVVAKSDTTQSDLYKEVKRIIDELNISRKRSITKPELSKKRILIVEDNPDAIVQLKAVLENENYLVDVAEGGQQALDYVKLTTPDGIIMDLMMPEIDGFEVLEKLRGSEATEKIPVLILTAKDLTKKDLRRLSSNNIQQLIHKGDVDIEGLLLKIKLMLSPLTELSYTAEEDKKTKASSSKEHNSDRKDGKPTILVFEDNLDNMVTIKAILADKFSISEASNGEKGLDIAQSQVTDLILLDMSLPTMDGEEVIKILKADDRTKHIPVIAVTAQAMMGDKEKFINFGCESYVSKPIDPETLLLEIGRLLSG